MSKSRDNYIYDALLVGKKTKKKLIEKLSKAFIFKKNKLHNYGISIASDF